MNILHVISSLNPRSGGVAEGLSRLLENYGQLAVHAEILVLDDPNNSPWLAKVKGVVHALGVSANGYGYSSCLLPWLKANAANYDAVIVEGLWQYPGYAVWKALRGTNIPYFVFTHGMLDPWFKHTYPLKHLKKWLYWPWGQYPVLRDAKAVLFTCEEERILARQSFWLYKANEVVVGYGTTRPTGDAGTQREIFLAKYPEMVGKRLFLFLSRIHEKKGCDLLIEAFAKFAKQDKALHLVMAGPDQTGWQSELVALSRNLGIEHRITWTGMVSGDVKFGAYHAAEAFVLPSHQENFGIVVAEALACGVPTLISNKVNIWREVEADGAGIVATDTVEGATALFEKWLAMDTVAQAAMREKAAKCFEARFEMGKAAQKLIDVISSNVK